MIERLFRQSTGCLRGTSNPERKVTNMARVEGIEPNQISFLMRQVFKKVRKILGRDITPQKIVARVPRV